MLEADDLSLALTDHRFERCLRSFGSEFQMLGPKQDKSAKVVSLAFVLLDFCWISEEEHSVRDWVNAFKVEKMFRVTCSALVCHRPAVVAVVVLYDCHAYVNVRHTKVVSSSSRYLNP